MYFSVGRRDGSGIRSRAKRVPGTAVSRTRRTQRLRKGTLTRCGRPLSDSDLRDSHRKRNQCRSRSRSNRPAYWNNPWPRLRSVFSNKVGKEKNYKHSKIHRQVGGAENGQDSGLIPFGRTDVQTLDEEAISHTLFDEGSALTGQTGDAASLMLPGPSGGSQGELHALFLLILSRISSSVHRLRLCRCSLMQPDAEISFNN